MQQSLRHIAFVIEELGVDTPAQQLLDRFLMGYPRDGGLHRVEDCQIHVWLAPGADDSELVRRIGDFGPRRHAAIDSATEVADGIVLVPRHIATADLLKTVVGGASANTAVFVHGAISPTAEETRQLTTQAADRSILLAAGTSTSVTWRLPQIELPLGTRLTDALI